MADVGSAVFRAIADFSRIRREARRTSRELGDLRDETKDANRALDDLGDEADDAGEALDDLGDEARETARELRDVDREGSAAARALTAVALAARRFDAGVRASPVGRFVGWLGHMRRRAIEAGVDIDRLDDRVDRIGKTFLRAGASVARFTALLGAIALATGALHATAAGVMSLLGAIGALSGALGLIPGLAAGVGIAVGAVKIGLTGFADAMKEVNGTTEEFTEAVKDLAPNARDTAWAVRGLRDQWKTLTQAVQNRLFRDTADDVRRLGAIYLPLLTVGLSDVADGVNGVWQNFAGWAVSQRTIRDVRRALSLTAQVIDDVADATKPLLHALRDIAIVGMETTAGLTEGFEDAANRFERFIRQARESGRLAEWMQDGVTATRRLGRSLGNLGYTLYGVFKAGDRVGSNFLQTLERLTGAMADFVHSARGQRALGSFFASARRAGEALLPVLAAIVTNLGDHVAPVLAKIAEKLGPGLVDVVDGIGAAFDNAGPALVVFFHAVSDLLSALGSAGPLIGDVAAGLATVLVPVLYALTGLIRAVTAAWNSLPAPVQAVIGVFGGAALAAGGLLIVLYKIIRAARKVKTAMATVAAVTGFSGAGGAAAAGAAGAAAQRGFLAKFGAGLKGKLGSILETSLLGMLFFPGAVGKLARKAKTLFTGGFKGTAPAATGIMARVGTAIKGVGPVALAVAGKLKWLRLAFSATPWGLAINGLILAGTAVWTHWDSVTAGVKTAWDGTVSFFQGLGPRIQGAWDAGTTWMANLPATTQQTVDAVSAWWDKLPGRIGYALGYAGGWVVRKFGEMRKQAVTDTTALVIRVSDWFNKLPGRINGSLAAADRWVNQKFTGMRDNAVTHTAALYVRTTDWFSKLPGRFNRFATDAGNRVKNAFRDMRNRAVTDTAALGTRTVGIIRALPGRLRAFVGDFVSVGRSLAEGLWRGIQSAAAKVRDAAVSMVVRAIQGAKAAAREGSPSKVFRDIGINIGEGLALGIERMRNRVLGVVTGLIARLRRLFGGGLGERLREQLGNLPGVAATATVTGSGTPRAPAAPTVGTLMARALPTDTGQAFPDVVEQLRAALSQTRRGERGGCDVTANFYVTNPLPEPASDTAARKLRTLALMGAFG